MLKCAGYVECHSGLFGVILTLPAVVSHVAFLTQAVVLSTWSPVHTPNITVLDCGQNNKNSNTHTHTHNVGVKLSTQTYTADYIYNINKMHSEPCFMKFMLRYNFLEIYGVQTDERIGLKRCELQESNMEEMLTVDVFQSIHTPNQLTHTHTQQPTRLTAICRNVIATYINCLGQYQGMF